MSKDDNSIEYTSGLATEDLLAELTPFIHTFSDIPSVNFHDRCGQFKRKGESQ